MNDFYSSYPSHPLHDVPLEVLETARSTLDQAVNNRDVDPEAAEPLADAVVMQLHEAGFITWPGKAVKVPSGFWRQVAWRLGWRPCE